MAEIIEEEKDEEEHRTDIVYDHFQVVKFIDHYDEYYEYQGVKKK